MRFHRPRHYAASRQSALPAPGSGSSRTSGCRSTAGGSDRQLLIIFELVVEFVVEFVQFVQFVEFLFICLEFVVEFIEILIQFLVIEQFFIFQRRRLHPGKDPQGVDSACNGLLDDGHDKPCSRLGMGPARQHLHLVGQLRFLRGLAGRCLSSTLCGAEHSVLAYLRASLCLAQGGHSLAQGETVEEWPCL